MARLPQWKGLRMSIRLLERPGTTAPVQTTYATETFATNWTQWSAINTGGSTGIASNVGTIAPPAANYQTARRILTAAGAQGDMTIYLEFSVPNLSEFYFDIGIAQNATGLANPKGVYASFYPAAAANDQNFSIIDSDGTYTGVEQKFPLTYVANAWYGMKIRRRLGKVSVKVWNLTGSEPYGYAAWNSHGIEQGTTSYLSVGATSGYSNVGSLKLRNITVKSYIDELGDTTPSSDTMPTASSVSSGNHVWALSSTNDFPTNVAEGGFRTAYPSVATYTEEQGDTGTGVTGGKYSTNKTVSVVNGILTVNQRVISGTPYGAMILADNYGSHTYGRAQFRSRQTDVAGLGGFKFVPLWWPSSDVWNEGEIDWPEADHGGKPRPASAIPGSYNSTTGNMSFYPVDSIYADYDTSGWHVYTVEWAPDAISFYQDGRIVQRMAITAGIPTKPMRFGFQAETWINEGTVPTAAVGKVELDWVVIYDLTS